MKFLKKITGDVYKLLLNAQYDGLMQINKLLIHLKGKCRSKKSEFKKVTSGLKGMKPKDAENLLTDLDEKYFSEIDCLECANCCRSLGPRLIERDVRRIAGELRMKPAAFIKKYLVRDEDGDLVFRSMPCPFLGEGNFCSIYPVRPRACEEYPHTSGKQVQSRLGLLAKNAETCPAVFLIMDNLSKTFF